MHLQPDLQAHSTMPASDASVLNAITCGLQYQDETLTAVHVSRLQQLFASIYMATILLTGTTGFVGSRLLHLALASPGVARVVSVTRKALPGESIDTSNSKLQEIVMTDEKDWLNWPAPVISAIGRVDACIWCLGITPSQRKDAQLTRKVSIDYVEAGLTAMLAGREVNPPSSNAPVKPLRFILLSGAMTERNPDAKLWLMEEYRKVRGAGESAALAFEEKRGRDVVQVAIARCGIITASDVSWPEWLKHSVMQMVIGLPTVPVADLNHTLLRVALEGTKKTMLENEDLRTGRV